MFVVLSHAWNPRMNAKQKAAVVMMRYGDGDGDLTSVSCASRLETPFESRTLVLSLGCVSPLRTMYVHHAPTWCTC